MYICNFKLNIKKILIICLVIAIGVALALEITDMNKDVAVVSFDYELDSKNFTDVLKIVHENIDSNVGKTIKLSGFVFTLPDFRDEQFVCGRDMLLDGDEKVVGFLCEYEKKFELADSEWVEITGEIIKGYYSGDMPIIKVKTLKKITAPTNTFVDTPEEL